MKKYFLTLAITMIAGGLSFTNNSFAEKKLTKDPKAITKNEYLDWRLISISHRDDNKTLRAILGNDIAIKATRKGKVESWPDGSIIAKIIWKERSHPNWVAAIIPKNFVKAEAMVKDSKKYASTGGWGFGKWVDGQLKMHSEKTTKTCFGCHSPMKANDYVYTFVPAIIEK